MTAPSWQRLSLVASLLLVGVTVAWGEPPPSTQPQSEPVAASRNGAALPLAQPSGRPTVQAAPAVVSAPRAPQLPAGEQAGPGPTTAPDPAAGDLLIEMDRFGRMTVAGRVIWSDELPGLLADYRAGGPRRRVELAVASDVAPGDSKALEEQCRAAGFGPDSVLLRPPPTQPAASAFPANDPRAAIALLTGQWQKHRRTVSENVATQREWFDQLDGRRRLLSLQYRELSDYLVRALRQYRLALSRLKENE